MNSRNIADRLPKFPLLLTLLFIVLVSALLRFQAIHWGVPTAGRFTTLYIDEYTCLRVLSLMDPSHWQFNPHYFIDPTFFYYQVGVLLKVASLTHYLTISHDQLYYLQHADLYARLYIVGRALTAFYGVLATLALFILGLEVTDSKIGGLMSAAFYAIVPVAVMSCHVIDVGVPVSFWMTIAMICFVDALRNRVTQRVPIVAGFFFAGLAFSTKYTAAPIFLTGLVCCYLCRASVGTAVSGLFGAALGFIVGTPYALLDLRGFMPQFLNAMGQASHSLPTVVWSHFIYPFYHYPYAVGTCLSVLCVVGLLRGIMEREAASWLALSFLIPYFFLLGKSNRHLARYVNETLPFLLPFGAQLLVSLWETRGLVLRAISLLLFIGGLSSVGYTLALNHSLIHETDPRDQASAWLIQHVPEGTPIGIDNDVAEFIHPGHLYMQFWKGKRYPTEAVSGPAYPVIGWDQQHQAWLGAPPPYWVDTHYFFEYTEKDATARRRNAETLVLMRTGYHPAQEFERHIYFGSIHYPFPKYAGFDWSHLFAHLTIYQKDAS